MSGSFDSVRCVHRLDRGLYPHPKGLWAMESESMLTPTDKFPSTGGSEKGRTRDVASRRTASPTHSRLCYSGPRLNRFQWIFNFHTRARGPSVN